MHFYTPSFSITHIKKHLSKQVVPIRYALEKKLANEAMLRTDEKLTQHFQQMITRALDEEQKNLFNIISGNSRNSE